MAVSTVSYVTSNNLTSSDGTQCAFFFSRKIYKSLFYLIGSTFNGTTLPFEIAGTCDKKHVSQTTAVEVTSSDTYITRYGLLFFSPSISALLHFAIGVVIVITVAVSRLIYCKKSV